MRQVIIEREPIELYMVLKKENLAASGGEAKYLIAEGLVRVNGSVETRKRKKITAGDIIEYAGDTLKIVAG